MSNISTATKRKNLAQLHGKDLGRFIQKQRSLYQDIETQELLSEKSNISLSMISKIEAGTRIPYYNMLISLADAIRSTPAEMVMILAGRNQDDAETQLINRLRQAIREYEEQKRGLEVKKDTPPIGETMQKSASQLAPNEDKVPDDMSGAGFTVIKNPKSEAASKGKPSQKVKPESGNNK